MVALHKKTKDQEMIMKSLIAMALVALGLFSAVPVQAADYNGYPGWAQRAFENYGG